jgi:twitching motility protein PilT
VRRPDPKIVSIAGKEGSYDADKHGPCCIASITRPGAGFVAEEFVIALKVLLENLNRPEVTEVALASERNPCTRVGDAYEPIAAELLSTEEILQLLFAAGGSRQVDSLGPKPMQWTARIEGFSPITVTAAMRGQLVHARFTLRPRDAAASAPPPRRPEGAGAERASALPDAPDAQRVSALPEPVSASLPRASALPPLSPSPEERVTPLLPGEPRTPISQRAASMPIGQLRPVAPSARPPRHVEVSGRSLGGSILSGPQSAPAAPVAAASSAAAPPRAAAPATGGSGPADRLFRDLLLHARRVGASDVHLVAERAPLLRIGGQIERHGEPLDPKLCEQALRPRVPQRLLPMLDRDGSADFALDEPGVGRLRVNVGRQRTGLKAALRLIPQEIPSLAALGLPEAIGAAAAHHQGLIMLTGPTGHGKTTTLAALVDRLNQGSSRHIITVEDPVEFVHPRRRAMMSQREVGAHTRSFLTALKAALREDPDVIVVGELRDTETVRMALSASETGHLVLGTMNTPSAAKAIDRLIDLFPPGDQPQVRATLAGGLRLVVGQRLLPATDGHKMVAAAEILPGSVPLWNLIRDSKTFQIPSLQQRGKGTGVTRLDDALADLVRAGKTTLAAALAVAETPDELEAAVGGRRAGLPPLEAPKDRDRPSGLPGQPGAPPPPEAPRSRPSGEMPPAGPRGLFERAGSLFGKRGT